MGDVCVLNLAPDRTYPSTACSGMPRADQCLLLLSILRSVLLTVADNEDKCSLVQKDLHLHGKFVAESDAGMAVDSSCECLGWREAYHSYFVQCGQGHEMDMM